MSHWGAFFIEDVPLVEFMYLVFTRMPVRDTVGDSGLCWCVPYLSSAVISCFSAGFFSSTGIRDSLFEFVAHCSKFFANLWLKIRQTRLASLYESQVAFGKQMQGEASSAPLIA